MITDAERVITEPAVNLMHEYFRILREEQDKEIDETLRRAQEQMAKAEKYLMGYYGNTTAARMQEFHDFIRESEKNPPIPTGFTKLDSLLGGGLREGLYAIGAISSLGKTAFTLQMADQVARSGHSVLIFSLEMSRFNLMARSISRISAITDRSSGSVLAKTLTGVLDGKLRNGYSTQELAHLEKSEEYYRAIADKKIFIWEAGDNISLPMINDTIAKHIEFTGQRPVVIVDYLQILPPMQNTGYGNLSIKQSVDNNVTMLKKISARYRVPLIVVSSLNRESYKKGASMEAFKESGIIEYSADVLIVLQYQDATDEEKLAAARRKDPREIELVVLKNRNGRAYGKIEYRYFAAYNHYSEK